jgi:hypothetical protein
VVGFVSSVERVATSHDQIGMASYFGKHIALRGMVSAAETDAIHRTLDRLSTSELDRVTRERRLHKETAALLHEPAHTLGAIHERSPDWLMSPVADSKQVSFSAASIRVIEVSLEFRGSTSSALLKAWAREYRAAIEAYPPDLAESSSREAAPRQHPGPGLRHPRAGHRSGILGGHGVHRPPDQAQARER